MNAFDRASSGELARRLSAASVEVSSGGHQLPELRDNFPPGTDVTITFLPGDDYRRNVETAVALRRAGFNPVPHIAAREMPSRQALDDFLSRARGEADVTRILLIAADDGVGLLPLIGGIIRRIRGQQFLTDIAGNQPLERAPGDVGDAIGVMERYGGLQDALFSQPNAKATDCFGTTRFCSATVQCLLPTTVPLFIEIGHLQLTELIHVDSTYALLFLLLGIPGLRFVTFALLLREIGAIPEGGVRGLRFDMRKLYVL